MISTMNAGRSYRAQKSTTRRATKPEAAPLYDFSKSVADVLWERAQKLAEVLAPEQPVDTEPLPERDQFDILMGAAAVFSPGFWDDPEALEDLYRLKLQFMGREDPALLEFAKVAKAQRDNMPDPDMTPANPKWEAETERLGVD